MRPFDFDTEIWDKISNAAVLEKRVEFGFTPATNLIPEDWTQYGLLVKALMERMNISRGEACDLLKAGGCHLLNWVRGDAYVDYEDAKKAFTSALGQLNGPKIQPVMTTAPIPASIPVQKVPAGASGGLDQVIYDILKEANKALSLNPLEERLTNRGIIQGSLNRNTFVSRIKGALDRLIREKKVRKDRFSKMSEHGELVSFCIKEIPPVTVPVVSVSVPVPCASFDLLWLKICFPGDKGWCLGADLAREISHLTNEKEKTLYARIAWYHRHAKLDVPPRKQGRFVVSVKDARDFYQRWVKGTDTPAKVEEPVVGSRLALPWWGMGGEPLKVEEPVVMATNGVVGPELQKVLDTVGICFQRNLPAIQQRISCRTGIKLPHLIPLLQESVKAGLLKKEKFENGWAYSLPQAQAPAPVETVKVKWDVAEGGASDEERFLSILKRLGGEATGQRLQKEMGWSDRYKIRPIRKKLIKSGQIQWIKGHAAGVPVTYRLLTPAQTPVAQPKASAPGLTWVQPPAVAPVQSPAPVQAPTVAPVPDKTLFRLTLPCGEVSLTVPKGITAGERKVALDWLALHLNRN